MDQPKWRIVPELMPLAVPVASLYKDPENFNEHNEDNLAGILSSLIDFGQLKPIVVREDGMIVAGNGTYDCALKLGAVSIAVVRVSGDYLSPDQLKVFGISDNITARTSFFNETALNEFVAKSLEYDPFFSVPGFTQEQLSEMSQKAMALAANPSATVAPEGDAAEGDLSEPEELNEDDVETRVKLGQLWKMGKHRLICADVTDPNNLATLLGPYLVDMVWSDPPYGQEYQSNFKKKKFAKIANDDTYLDCGEVYKCVKDGGAAYVCCRWDHYPHWFENTAEYFKIKNCIIWHKPGGGLGDLEGAYIFNHEMIIFGAKGKHVLNGKRSADVWEISKDAGVNYQHPTQKPVALSSQAIERSSPVGGRVLVPFGGGGGDVIACERLARTCYVAELEPHYCDVILARWEKETGMVAELICDIQND